MRTLNGILAAVLVLGGMIQASDPATANWMPVYAVGAFWALLAAAMPRLLALRPLVMMLSFTMAATLLALVYFWPDTPGWWRAGQWRPEMGLILVALALLGPILTSIRMERTRRRERLEEREAGIAERHRAALTGGRASDL